MRKILVLLNVFLFLFLSSTDAYSNCEEGRKKIKVYAEEEVRIKQRLEENRKETEEKRKELKGKETEWEKLDSRIKENEVTHKDLEDRCKNAESIYKEYKGNNPETERGLREERDSICDSAKKLGKELDILKIAFEKIKTGKLSISKKTDELKKERGKIFSELENLRIPVEIPETEAEGSFDGKSEDAHKFENEIRAQAERKAAEQAGSSITSETIVSRFGLEKDDIRLKVSQEAICAETIYAKWDDLTPGEPGPKKYTYKARYIFVNKIDLTEKLPSPPPSPPPPPSPSPEPPTKSFSWKRGLWAMVFHGGERNEFQLVPAILFAGSVGSFFYFDSQYNENWSKYESSTNSSDRRSFYDKASQSHNNEQISLRAGIGIWALNVIISFIQDNQEVGKPIKFSPITTYIIPQPDGGIVLLSYSF